MDRNSLLLGNRVLTERQTRQDRLTHLQKLKNTPSNLDNSLPLTYLAKVNRSAKHFVSESRLQQIELHNKMLLTNMQRIANSPSQALLASESA